ncbi:hypothetical protein [Streptomyces sp. Agncl-13]|uniref:hypothetical protein n=1 Tax=Streptomyces sp. Agncl-13 TaxID=3400628 RepID=UPI003A8C78C9
MDVHHQKCAVRHVRRPFSVRKQGQVWWIDRAAVEVFCCHPASGGGTDRITYGGNIIETGTDSYRLAHTQRTKAPG